MLKICRTSYMYSEKQEFFQEEWAEEGRGNEYEKRTNIKKREMAGGSGKPFKIVSRTTIFFTENFLSLSIVLQ